MKAQQGREVQILGAVRTPIGRGNSDKGIYRNVHPTALLGLTYRELLKRSGLNGAYVDLVLAGCVMQFGAQSLDVARNAWLSEGLPIEASATTLDTQCGSGQQAIGFASALISSNIHDVVIGSGVEHMGSNSFERSRAINDQYGGPWTPEFFAAHNVQGQGIGAELIVDKWGIKREDMDQFALRSHQKAAHATISGDFDREIVEVQADGEIHSKDQGIRYEASIESLRSLKPAFKPDGTITAGLSSQISDGAASVLLASAEKASELGIRGRARILDSTSVGCDPVTMLEGPIPATLRILERNSLRIEDIDIIEINEAFAPVVLAFVEELGVDMSRINPRGGAIALGHPLGSSGARLVTTLVHELEDLDKEIGLVTMCCGGGLGTATLIQRI
jgi:acetyl-CoA acyltransferase